MSLPCGQTLNNIAIELQYKQLPVYRDQPLAINDKYMNRHLVSLVCFYLFKDKLRVFVFLKRKRKTKLQLAT